jgi:predicted methyltransferase
MHFTVEAQNKIRSHIVSVRPPAPVLALDGTAGNGFDTCFLAELVGEEGRVVAIDLQLDAIQITRNKLEALGWSERVDCICDCHSNVLHHLQSRYSDSLQCSNGLQIVMFNLGYLPFGNKEIITKRDSTLVALAASFDRLAETGIMSVLSYPGHTGGSEEHLAVTAWVEGLKQRAHVESYRDENNLRSPVLWIIAPR